MAPWILQLVVGNYNIFSNMSIKNMLVVLSDYHILVIINIDNIVLSDHHIYIYDHKYWKVCQDIYCYYIIRIKHLCIFNIAYFC